MKLFTFVAVRVPYLRVIEFFFVGYLLIHLGSMSKLFLEKLTSL